jgi:signal transduction histidine kinase
MNLLTTRDVASILGIPPAAVCHALRSGDLPDLADGMDAAGVVGQLPCCSHAPLSSPDHWEHAPGEDGEWWHDKQTADAVFIVDAAGRWRYWNHAAALLRVSDIPHPEARREMELAYPRYLDESPCVPTDFPTERALRGEIVTGLDLILLVPQCGERIFRFSAAPLSGTGEAVTGAIVVARPGDGRARRERLLHAVTAVLAAATDTGALLDGFVAAIARTVGIWCALYGPTPDGAALQPRASADGALRRTALTQFLQAWTVSPGHGPIGRAATTGVTQSATVAEFLDTLPPAACAAVEHAEPIAIWATPLRHGGQTLAVLALAGALPNDDEEGSDARLIALLATRVATRLAALRADSRPWQVDRQRDEILAVAAHELRAPLTSALGYAQVARRRLAREQRHSAWEEEVLARIERHLRRLNRLTGDLLEASRANEGHLRLRRGHGDLRVVVSHVVEEVRASTGRTIRWEPPADSLMVHADLDRIAQVVQNLLSNAIRYSPASRPIEVTVGEGCVLDPPLENAILLTVRDYGHGIAPADLPFIFDRFYRAPTAQESAPIPPTPAAERGQSDTASAEEYAPHHGGLGLGLYIARQIVESHGGRMEAMSVLSEGTTMRVWLPKAL